METNFMFLLQGRKILKAEFKIGSLFNVDTTLFHPLSKVKLFKTWFA